jgi:hypothetical protein
MSCGPHRRKPTTCAKLAIRSGGRPHSGHVTKYAAAAGVKRSRQLGQQTGVITDPFNRSLNNESTPPAHTDRNKRSAHPRAERTQQSRRGSRSLRNGPGSSHVGRHYRRTAPDPTLQAPSETRSRFSAVRAASVHAARHAGHRGHGVHAPALPMPIPRGALRCDGCEFAQTAARFCGTAPAARSQSPECDRRLRHERRERFGDVSVGLIGRRAGAVDDRF